MGKKTGVREYKHTKHILKKIPPPDFFIIHYYLNIYQTFERPFPYPLWSYEAKKNMDSSSPPAIVNTTPPLSSKWNIHTLQHANSSSSCPLTHWKWNLDLNWEYAVAENAPYRRWALVWLQTDIEIHWWIDVIHCGFIVHFLT